MPGIRKSLLLTVFSGSYMRRWNDKLRPVELTEIDKQGHKMIIAFLLWHGNSLHHPPPHSANFAAEIIHAGRFDYFYRPIVTNCKLPIVSSIKIHTGQYTKLA